MNKEQIIESLLVRFENKISNISESYNITEITVEASENKSVAKYLYEVHGFTFLTDLCGVHYPNQSLQLGVVYHFHNLLLNIRLRMKCFLEYENPCIETLSDLYSAANWMERETYDFYGIKFTNHPDLTRILNVEYLDYFPLRKEYPLEDPTREDKTDKYFGR